MFREFRSLNLKVWSLPQNKLLTTLTEDGKSPQFSPDGRMLAFYKYAGRFEDKHVNIWSLPEGTLLATLQGAGNKVTFSPDSKLIVSNTTQRPSIVLWDIEKPSFRTFLFDPKVNGSNAITYNVYDKITGQSITYTLPCGSRIPQGARCTCNCVRGTFREPEPTYGGGGTICTCNKVCTCIPVPSDRNAKEAFETTNPLLILQRLSELPIQTWNYKWNDAAIRHIGPMAQDFAAAFAVGEDDKHICPVDAQGVAFAAIQGLYKIMQEKDARTEHLQAQLHEQQEANRALQSRLEALERMLLPQA